MSFPRAKITRFNENTPCTPSPAEYNINLNTNINCPKFTELREPNKCNSDTASSISVSSTPCFRTPTLIKKKKIYAQTLNKIKNKDLFNNGLQVQGGKEDGKTSDIEKELFIKDLHQQIEDMKEQLGLLETNNFDILDQKNKLLEKLNDLKEEQQMILQNTYLEHDKEVKKIKDQINKLEIKLLFTQERYNQQLEEKKLSEHQKEEVLTELQKRVESLLFEKEELITSNKQLQENYATKLEEEKAKHIEELNNLIKEHKIIMDELELKMEQRYGKILKESEDKINQMEENCKEANLLTEMQMQEKFKDFELQWQLKLESKEKDSEAILKECQEISEFSIIQCEREKQTIKLEVLKHLNKLEILEKENADLVISLKELEMKFKDLDDSKSSTHKSEIEKMKNELSDINNQKKLYEISINKTHETIQTLKRRLLDSDRDVEQLKTELEHCEKEKLETQTKCVLLNEDLKVLNGLNEDLELQFDNMQKWIQVEIENVQIALFSKLEEYGMKAQNDISNLENSLKSKEWLLQEARSQLENEQFLRESAQNLISSVGIEIQENEEKISNLELENKNYLKNVNELKGKIEIQETENYILSTELKVALNDKYKMVEEVDKYKENEEKLLKENNILQEKSDSYLKYCDYYKGKAAEYEDEVEDLSNVNKKYIEQSGKYDALLQEFEAMKVLNEHLQKKIADQELLIGPFRNQLEDYEMERRALLDQKSEAELEAKNMGLKYASLLGHQNQKQKIKHLIDLKEKNYELLESNKDLEQKVKTQSKTIEKLKKELSTITHSPRKPKMTNAEKENVASPNRIINARVESPNRYLRDRNN